VQQRESALDAEGEKDQQDTGAGRPQQAVVADQLAELQGTRGRNVKDDPG
jgi:hypothetical protein